MQETLNETEPQCPVCGRSLSESLYLSEGGRPYCCEGCHLSRVGAEALRYAQRSRDQGMVEALVTALDAREHETGLHSKRVACHTLVLARQFTNDPEELTSIYYGALLHDIGKIAIPDRILLKPGPLTVLEREEMETHPQQGYEILLSVPQLRDTAAIVLAHEERFDGDGYPNRLVGHAIPIGARLLAIIDTLDAMTSDRAYRAGLSFDTARKEILAHSGSQFDPEVVEAFLSEEPILRKMVGLKCTGPQLFSPPA